MAGVLIRQHAGLFLSANGFQRTLLYWIGQPKSSDRRITRALAVVDHLKANNGKVNYRMLMGPKTE